MDQLSEQLKVVLADTFAMYLKSQNFHWNVEGDDFPMYHSFFGDLYGELYGAVDPIAEHIRTLDVYSPGSLGRFKELTSISDSMSPPPVMTMIKELYTDNSTVTSSLTRAYKLAESNSKFGLANFLQDRIDAHEKHAWMLRSMLKRKE
jgi:starvation-inducible DNA-binding protein